MNLFEEAKKQFEEKAGEILGMQVKVEVSVYPTEIGFYWAKGKNDNYWDLVFFTGKRVFIHGTNKIGNKQDYQWGLKVERPEEYK